MAGGAVALMLLVNSCGTERQTVVAPPVIAGASFVGDRACFDCHQTISRAFPQSPHARLHLESSGMAGQQGCEACHGPGSRHIAAGGGTNFIVNPGHSPEACFQCHLEVHAQFSLPQHHPVVEGRMNCVQCHDPHGLDIMKPAGGLTLAMSRENESCAQCHRQETRPFVSLSIPRSVKAASSAMSHTAQVQRKAAQATGQQPMPALSCAGPDAGGGRAGRNLHRQGRPHFALAIRVLLDERLSLGGAWIQYQPLPFLLSPNLRSRFAGKRLGTAERRAPEPGRVGELSAWALIMICLFGTGKPLLAAEGDAVLTNLPPPAAVTIDFDRDIKPIFDNSCFQCHSALKPRSHFRLEITASLRWRGGR